MIPAEHVPREVSMMQLIPKSSLGGTAVATTGVVTHSETLALLGFGITVLSFFVNLYFQIQKHKREAELNAVQIASINKD